MIEIANTTDLRVSSVGNPMSKWICDTCDHTPEECEDCYPELGYKNDKAKRDIEAAEEYTRSEEFAELVKATWKGDTDG